MKNKEIEELLEDIKRHLDYVNDSGLKSIRDTEMEKMYYYILDLQNNRDKAINYTDITIELIEQQPTEDDTWILDRLKGFKNILRGESNV